MCVCVRERERDVVHLSRLSECIDNICNLSRSKNEEKKVSCLRTPESNSKAIQRILRHTYGGPEICICLREFILPDLTYCPACKTEVLRIAIRQYVK